jgi:hypothetical protein
VQAPPTLLLAWPNCRYRYSTFTLKFVMTPYSRPAPAVQPFALRVLLFLFRHVVGQMGDAATLLGGRLQLRCRSHAARYRRKAKSWPERTAPRLCSTLKGHSGLR